MIYTAINLILAVSSNTPLARRLVALKDNICTVGTPTTCASKILGGFVSPFPATIVNKLQAAGAVIVGKTNLDEFGMGSYSTHSAFGAVQNFQKEGHHVLTAGGSSGGSAVAVGTGECWAALGTDTGGSVRAPASYTGIVGFKPSYGLLSRFGVVPYANSLDTVGILVSDTQSAKEVFDVLKGHDSKDPTSVSLKTLNRLEQSQNTCIREWPLKIGVPLEYNIAEVSDPVRDAWCKAIQTLENQGHSIQTVSLPTTKLALSAYYIIAPAEAASNLAKYDGARYGNTVARELVSGGVLFASTRNEGLGDEVRRRILLGSYSLSASAIDNYFLKAQKIRRLVQHDFNRAFRQGHPLLEEYDQPHDHGVDILITPTTPTLPPRLADVIDQPPVETYQNDILTVPASLAGLPAITIPVYLSGGDKAQGEEDLKSVGIQLLGQYGSDNLVLETAAILESGLNR